VDADRALWVVILTIVLVMLVATLAIDWWRSHRQ
jgi:hypothetical protein